MMCTREQLDHEVLGLIKVHNYDNGRLTKLKILEQPLDIVQTQKK